MCQFITGFIASGSDGRTMPSREGFETWFDYELLLLGIAILAATLYVATRVVLGILRNGSIDPVELLGPLVGLCVLVILASVWWVGTKR